MRKAASLVICLLSIMMCRSVVADVQYVITDLGSLSGPAGYSIAWGINNSGVVVGETKVADGIGHAFMWTIDGGMQDLGTLGGTNSQAFSINDLGVVVGSSYTTGDTASQAFTYTAGGPMTSLGTLGGSNSLANSINKSGDIVGASDITGATAYHAFLYRGGIWTDLHSSDGYNSTAWCINNSGVIAGELDTGTGTTAHAFVLGDTLEDLGTFGGANSCALAINDSGVVVGYADTAGIYTHAFRYSGGLLEDIGAPDTDSFAYGINSSGVIVGVSNSKAVKWDTGGMVDLNTLIDSNAGWQLEAANGINKDGQIVGSGRTTQNGTSVLHAYLLTPASSFGSVSGIISLGSNYQGDITKFPIMVELCKHEGSTTTRTVNLDPSGAFTLQNVPIGIYDISFKASHWLKKVVYAVEVKST